MNKHMIGGIIKSTVVLKHTTTGKAVVNMVVETDDTYSDKSGKRHKSKNIHHLEFWDKTAEMIAKFYKRGKYIVCEGRVEVKEHNEVTRSIIIVSSVEDISKEEKRHYKPKAMDLSNPKTTDLAAQYK